MQEQVEVGMEDMMVGSVKRVVEAGPPVAPSAGQAVKVIAAGPEKMMEVDSGWLSAVAVVVPGLGHPEAEVLPAQVGSVAKFDDDDSIVLLDSL